MPDRNGSEGNYRYGFQGQEKDDEIKGEGNSINYKYRMHDPRLGRFFAVDPLAYKYPYYSPYHFSSNSPILAIELEGLESSVTINYSEGSVTINKKGNRFEISQTDFMRLKELGGKTRHGNASQDIGPGGQMDVFCPDCGSGAWHTISLPALQITRYIDVPRQVTETVKGTDDETKRKTKTPTGYFKWEGTWTNSTLVASDKNVNSQFGVLSSLIDGLKPKDGYEYKVEGIILIARENTDFNAKLLEKLEKKFDMPISFEIDPGLNLGGEQRETALKVIYKGKKIVKGTPDSTITKTVIDKKPVTVNPVETTP